MFLELLLERFPEYTASAFFINTLEFYFIEILLVCAVLISLFTENKNNKKGILAFSLACFLVTGLFVALYYFIPDTTTLILIPAFILLVIFGILGLIRFFKIRYDEK